MEILRGLVLYLHFIVASVIVFFSHILVAFMIPDLFPKLVSLTGGAYFQLTPFLSVLTGFGLSYLYFRRLGIDRPAKRALVSTITGTVLFWGSCVALVCSIAPALRNM